MGLGRRDETSHLDIGLATPWQSRIPSSLPTQSLPACSREAQEDDTQVNEELNVQEIIARLGLTSHPEGGYYAETFRSKEIVTLSDGRLRSASTAIHFLLPAGSFSALHRVAADEVWHHYGGSPLELVTISPDGHLDKILLGRDLLSGQHPQHVVPSGWWQGARPLDRGATLTGCTVAPGFDFQDFEMPSRSVLLDLFPQHAPVILEFTYPRETVIL